jgi:hypothetical protein
MLGNPLMLTFFCAKSSFINMPPKIVYEMKKHVSVREKIAIYNCYKEFAALHLNKSKIIIRLMRIFSVSSSLVKNLLILRLYKKAISGVTTRVV